MAERDSSSPHSCLFCQIAVGDVGTHIVFEDAEILAFLDTRPIRPGHIQIVPRRHFDYFEELPADIAHQVMTLGQRIAKVQKRLYGVTQVAFLFSGGDIAHAHAHLVPMHEKTDITSRQYIKESPLTFEPRPLAATEELEGIAAELRRALQQR